MLANGRDGNRSGVSPLTSLVVSQKNWKVRRSMSRNSGGSSGGPGGSSSRGSGSGSTTCGIGPGLGGATAGSAGCGASRWQAASRSSGSTSEASSQRGTVGICICALMKPITGLYRKTGCHEAAGLQALPVDTKGNLEHTRRPDRPDPIAVPVIGIRLPHEAAPCLVVGVVLPVEDVEDVRAHAQPEIRARVPDPLDGDVELLETDGAVGDEWIEEAVGAARCVVAVGGVLRLGTGQS